MKIFLLLIDWIWRRFPPHPTLREAALTTTFIPLKKEAFNHKFSGASHHKEKYFFPIYSLPELLPKSDKFQPLFLH